MLYRIMRSLEQVLRQLLLLKLLVGPSIDDKFFNSFKVIVLVGGATDFLSPRHFVIRQPKLNRQINRPLTLFSSSLLQRKLRLEIATVASLSFHLCWFRSINYDA